jgi:hypothetical protein
MAKRYQRVIRSSRKLKNVYSYFWLPFGIFWPLHCLSFFGLRLFLITLWYLLAIVLSVILWFTFLITLWYLLAIVLSVILRFTATSDYPLVSFDHCIVCHSSVYGYFWLPIGIVCPLYSLSFVGLRLLLITIWYLLAIVLSVILHFTATSDYPLVSFGHCIFSHSSLYALSDYSFVSFGYYLATRYQRVIRSSRKPTNDRQCNVQKIPKGNQKVP